MSNAIFLQLIIVVAWAATLLRNTRRLFRLAHAGLPMASRSEGMGKKAHRLWWWLGRDEYWNLVWSDAAYCVELTLMVFLLGLSF